MVGNILVLAYPGCGKTFVAENYNDVSDFEFQHYRYDYGKYKELPLEKLKGRTEIRTPKEDWPNNFIKDLEKELKKRKCVLVPFATSLIPYLEYFEKQNIRIIIAIQSKDSFDDLIETLKKRGNDFEFIERRKNDFLKVHSIIENLKYEKVYLNKNEYLYDAFLKLGITLTKGKGYKNYK